jgi:hypothetical protein
MGQKLSHEKRLAIAARIYRALRAFYQDRLVILSDTRALRLPEEQQDTQSSGKERD